MTMTRKSITATSATSLMLFPKKRNSPPNSTAVLLSTGSTNSTPAYAATIHKNQSSEDPAVVIPVMMAHYAMLHRNVLYTGVTRGKKLAVLVGQKKTIAIAVRDVAGRRRWSKLG